MEQWKSFIQIIIIRIKKKIKRSLGRKDRESVEERERERFIIFFYFFVSFSDLLKLDLRFSSE